MENQENKSVEIDVFAVLKVIWKHKILIMSISFVFALAAFAYSVFFAELEYQSTSRIYVVSRQDENNAAFSNTDLQAAAYLVQDYKEIILSQNVLSEVVHELNLDMTSSELAERISVLIPTDTRILSITVSDSRPAEAARIANGIKDVASKKIISITKVSDVMTLDEAEIPQSPSSPNIRRNVILGFIIGIVFMIFILIVKEVVDDRIKKPEDIEEVMGLSLLGVIPDIKKM